MRGAGKPAKGVVERPAKVADRLREAPRLDGGMAEAEEWFDVVDAADRVIGRERRRDVHRLGLWHRAVHVFVFDPTGRIFLQKRSASKDTHPGRWDSSASGHVDSGEDYDACAPREVFEELGWTPDAPIERLFKVAASEATGWEFVWVYRTRGLGPFVLNVQEIETGDWFDPAEVDARIAAAPDAFSPGFVMVWAECRRRRLAH
jgi:isopentenyl-diphosphate delta-isomerase type 1